LIYERIITKLKQQVGQITVDDLINQVCEEDGEINKYIGPDHRVEYNRIIRDLQNMLRNNDSIRPVKQRPLTIEWVEHANNEPRMLTDT
jgi:hypothetical protein